MGYVEAWDINTHERLWEKQVYSVRIDPHRETDIQWVFITKLNIKNGKLIVVNEDCDKYEVNIENIDVSQTDSNSVSKNNPGILLLFYCSSLGLFYINSQRRRGENFYIL